MSRGLCGSRPAMRSITACAQTCLAHWREADFGIAPAMAASPMTWMSGTRRDSKVVGVDRGTSRCGRRSRDGGDASARWGGMIQATSALTSAKVGADDHRRRIDLAHLPSA